MLSRVFRCVQKQKKGSGEELRSLENMRFFISLRTEVHDGRL